MKLKIYLGFVIQRTIHQDSWPREKGSLRQKNIWLVAKDVLVDDLVKHNHYHSYYIYNDFFYYL